MHHHDEIRSIEASELDEVTGGAADPSSVGAALQGITSSIAELAKNKNGNGSNSLSTMLPLMLMLGKGGGGGACPCGCGMANCMGR